MKSIRERRQEKGLTLAELGRMIGLHPSNISRIETGLQLPSVSAAINLAEVLNITMDEIYMADHDEE